jgi:transposase
MVELPYLLSPNCQIEEVEQTGSTLRVRVRTLSTESCCPICAVASKSIHSYHLRQLKDLPAGDQAVLLSVRTKRFRCRNPDCPKTTFVEEIPGHLGEICPTDTTPEYRVMAHWTGCGWSSRCATCLPSAHAISGCTLLRILRQHGLPDREAASVIGIDDWAKRKGQRYGTIVVDLERHQVVDLLEDRESDTVAAWLQTQPQVHTVARDRSLQCAQGIAEGAPQAVQIADRWHLLKNLSETVERALQELLPKMKRKLTLSVYDNAPREKFPRAAADQERQAASRAQRLRDYTLVQYLRREGHGERRIARVLGLSRGKVHAFYHAETFPERKGHYVRSMLDPYLPYLEQRVSEGCLNAIQLWREIRERGYPASSSQVSKWMTKRRRGTQREQAQTPPAAALSLPNLRTCVRLITTARDRLSPEDSFLLQQLRLST